MQDGIPDLPKSSLLQRIYQYTSERSKAPDSIIFWSVMALLGASLKDKIMIDWAVKPIFPNLPLIIVAPSGWGKTGAIRASENIFEGNLPYRISEDSTAESAIWQFAKFGTHPNNSKATTAIWIVPELADVFGKKDYQQGLISRITRLLDSPRNHCVTRKKKGDSFMIKGYAVLSWISCTTFQWLVDAVEDNMATGGFLPRLMPVVTEEPPKKITNPARNRELEEMLQVELHTKLGSLKNGLALSIEPQVNLYLEKNYDDMIAATGLSSQPFIARRDENFLRIYLILKVFSGLTEIEDVLRLSYGFCKSFERNSLSLYQRIYNSKIRNYDSEVHDALLRKGRKSVREVVSYAKICRDLGVHSDALKPVLNNFKERGYVDWDGRYGESGKVMFLDGILEAVSVG